MMCKNHSTNGGKCQWRGHSANRNQPLIPVDNTMRLNNVNPVLIGNPANFAILD